MEDSTFFHHLWAGLLQFILLWVPLEVDPEAATPAEESFSFAFQYREVESVMLTLGDMHSLLINQWMHHKALMLRNKTMGHIAQLSSISPDIHVTSSICIHNLVDVGISLIQTLHSPLKITERKDPG